MYNFTCTPKVITSYLLSITGLLLTANFFVIHRSLVAPEPVLRGYRAAFYFGADASIPSVFIALLLSSCAVILWKAASFSTNVSVQKTALKILAVVFGLLMIEGFFNIHTLLFNGVTDLVESLSPPYITFIWIAISILFFLLVSSIILGGLVFLPDPLKGSFIGAAFLFMLGVVVNSSIYPVFTAAFVYLTVTVALAKTTSLLLQIVAIVQFLHALIAFYLSYVEKPDIRINFFPTQRKKPAGDDLEDRLTEMI